MPCVTAVLPGLGYWEMYRYINSAEDLPDLQAAFAGPRSAFWVAIDSHRGDGTSVAGCIGLVPTGEVQTAELVRFVVDKHHRGQGVGQALVAALEGHATQLGYATLTLRTNNILKPALSFYAKAGFELERIQRRRLLRGDLLFYRKPLHVLRKIVA